MESWVISDTRLLKSGGMENLGYFAGGRSITIGSLRSEFVSGGSGGGGASATAVRDRAFATGAAARVGPATVAAEGAAAAVGAGVGTNSSASTRGAASPIAMTTLSTSALREPPT